MSVTAAVARGLSSPAEVASPAELSTGPERAGARIEFASRWGREAVGPLHPSRARWGRVAAGQMNTRCPAQNVQNSVSQISIVRGVYVQHVPSSCARMCVRRYVGAHTRTCACAQWHMHGTSARTYAHPTRARVPWHVRKARARPQSARVRARMHIGTCARQVRALAIFSLPSLDQGGHASRSPPSVLLLRTSNVRIFSLRLPPRHLSVASLFCGLPARSGVIVRSEEACNCP